MSIAYTYKCVAKHSCWSKTNAQCFQSSVCLPHRHLCTTQSGFFLQIYKITDCCRPEVASDVISGQKVGTIQVNIVTKFEGPSSNRLGAIKFAHGRYDGDGDDGDVRRSTRLMP